MFQIIFEFLQTPLLNLGRYFRSDDYCLYLLAFILVLPWSKWGSVVGAVFNPILQTLSVENIEFFKTVLVKDILFVNNSKIYLTFGVVGSTLSLIIVMLLFCKSKRITELGKLSLVPGILESMNQSYLGY